MAIIKLDDFAENGDKNLTGIDVQQGFVQAEKPARQWFNSLFNSIVKKVNEVITDLESLVISTDKIADGAVTLVKIDPNIKILGNMIAKDADLNTPKLSATYALTTLDAPNINLAADGTLKRSNDPLNASTRKVGIAVGNLVERGADGYPTNTRPVGTAAGNLVERNATGGIDGVTSLGVGQTWQDMTASRSDSVTYTNTTGRTIALIVRYKAYNTNTLIDVDGYINGVIIIKGTMYASTTSYYCQMSLIIPSGATYSFKRAISTHGLDAWWELR